MTPTRVYIIQEKPRPPETYSMVTTRNERGEVICALYTSDGVKIDESEQALDGDAVTWGGQAAQRQIAKLPVEVKLGHSFLIQETPTK